MAQEVDRCDIIDILEEAARLGGEVNVRTTGGDSFVDAVRDVTTEGGEDFAVFRTQGRLSLSQIQDCTRARPVQSSYDAKL